jgi:hypothetical protein
MGLEKWIIAKFKEKKFGMFGKLAFAFTYSPQNATDEPLRQFLTTLLDEEPSNDQLAALRRLFFEGHTMALTDVRQRVESSPDQLESCQEKRLGGIVFTPRTIPSNRLVDTFVAGILTYDKAANCCSRAQEVKSVKKDHTVSTDAAGMRRHAEAGFQTS